MKCIVDVSPRYETPFVLGLTNFLGLKNAARYGNLCLDVSQEEGVQPFFLGFAYEALARAAAAAGNRQDMVAYLDKAKSAADEVQEADNRKLLLADLETISIPE